MPDPQLSKSVRQSRREAIFVGSMWCAAAAYTLGYCALFGYGRTVEDLKFVFGVPDWVFWGVIAPWSVCLAVGCWFAWFYMTDEQLGEDPPVSHLADSQEASDNG